MLQRSEPQDSSKEGAVETGCSGSHSIVGCFTIQYYPHPLHPPPTAPPFDEYNHHNDNNTNDNTNNATTTTTTTTTKHNHTNTKQHTKNAAAQRAALRGPVEPLRHRLWRR